MATATTFDLSLAIQRWREKLVQSPHFKAENVAELETHVRDSAISLQAKGLSSEESFLIATHRVGSPAKLEPEFAKVNRNPWNMIVHALILVFFSVCCWFLWGILHFPQMMSHASVGRPLPAFTQLVMGCGSYLFVPPVLAAIYCAYVWMRKPIKGNSWMGFFAVIMASLILIALPTFTGVFLPVIDLLQQLGSR